MTNFPIHLLAALDPEGGDDHVLAQSVWLGERYGAPVHALTVLPPPIQVQRGLATMEIDFERDLTEAATAGLQARCERHSLNPACAHVVRGPAESTLGRFANQHGADLVIVGAHDRHGAEYFLGTFATGALRYADAAVFACHVTGIARPYRRLLLALSLDEPASLMSQLKTLVDREGQADIFACHIARPLLPAGMHAEVIASASTLQSLDKARKQALAQQLETQLQTAGIAVAESHLLEGVASANIKDLARRLDVDLIVVGTGQHLGLGWHVGSTTNAVIHGAPCHVLALRPGDDE